jgi:hypothetical protein
MTDIRERLFQLERMIAPLEWDASRNQINEFKKLQLGKLKEEYQKLVKECKE